MRIASSWFRLCLPALLVGAAPAAAQMLAPNLSYTSVLPCRVFDTRSSTNGKLIHGVAQTFNVVGGDVNPTTFTSQGGHGGGCSLPGFDTNSLPQVQAVVFNFVAVGSAGAGDIVAWPSDQAQPLSSVINYANSASLGFLNIANGIIVPVRQDSQGADITLLAQVSDTHVLADVVGFFSGVSAVQGTGIDNLFLGTGAGNPSLSTGSANTAFGYNALSSATTGGTNTAVGNGALRLNAAASGNTAVGFSALLSNTTGSGNTAVGSNALNANAGGAANNTAVGASALVSNTVGSSNVALGSEALILLSNGGHNIGVGMLAGASYTGESNNIVIGNQGTGGDSGVIRIGAAGTQTKAFIAGISGATSSSGTTVFVNSSGQLGTSTSSRRFKEDVVDMGEASDGLMRLRPVTFRYKAANDDGSRLLQYGLIAEEVAAVYPDLVQYDEEGQPRAVRYHFVNAMLLNEVQRQRGRIAALEAEIAHQQRQAAAQESRMKGLEARLARLEGGGKTNAGQK
jgi:hypothetical protein